MEDYGTPGAITLLTVNYGIGKVTTEFLVFPDVDAAHALVATVGPHDQLLLLLRLVCIR